MRTPIADFVRGYAAADAIRLHMPGHKGISFLGCESLDITEIAGADTLYEASGIIAESEQNASALFGSRQTLFSTEGSSQCIRAMLYLALMRRAPGTPPVIVAARNVHKAFLYAAALLDFEPVWLWPEMGAGSLCSCPVLPKSLEQTLKALTAPPAAVYITSPDYLGGMADISSLAEVCRRHNTILIVDNAHGAYLRFLNPSQHPLDLGAALCCDSAHKTLPVLTGGAYLHIAKHAPDVGDAKEALALFGSTSPSYLTLVSLDLCNAYLAADYSARLSKTAALLGAFRFNLRKKGWDVLDSDPLRVAIRAPTNLTGTALADRLYHDGISCEYADPDFLVFMASPENDVEELGRTAIALGENHAQAASRPVYPVLRCEQILTVRQALFAPHEVIPAVKSLGRICGAPMVSCPPAIPIVVSGERIGKEAVTLFQKYGIKNIAVLKEMPVYREYTGS